MENKKTDGNGNNNRDGGGNGNGGGNGKRVRPEQPRVPPSSPSYIIFNFNNESIHNILILQNFTASPSQTTINTLGVPVAGLNHPAITVCKYNGIFDAGEYLRAVFDNFEYACNGSETSKSCQRNREDPFISTEN
jgi:hypothetical protein